MEQVIVIGERLNSTRQQITRAIQESDSSTIKDVAQAQVSAGAHLVDVNAGTFLDQEPEYLTWLVTTVQEAVDVPLSIDSAHPAAFEQAFEAHRGRALLNSVSGERLRLESLLPLIKRFKPFVIALCMDDSGLPGTSDGTLTVAENLIERLVSSGIGAGDIYLDPLVRPVGTNPSFGKLAVESITRLKKHFPESRIVCGLSNVSFGLPKRRLLNQNFLSMVVAAGIDAVIADPLDRRLMANLTASMALCGRDEYCRDYLKSYREGKLP